MRITSIAGKIAFVVAAIIVVFLVALLVLVTVGTAAGSVAAGVLLLASVVVGGRWFRGEGEPVEPPRPSWQFTSRPTAGWVLAGLSLLQAVGGGSVSGGTTDTAPAIIAAVTYVVIALLYINSSLRLRQARALPTQKQ